MAARAPVPKPDQVRVADWFDGAIVDIRKSAIIREWMKRVAAGRDLRIIISADNAATGVGKTTLAVVLCILMDIWGFREEKATLDPREFSVLYDQFTSLSAMLLDEAEQAADARRSMSKENLALGHDFMTKRYRQIMATMTLPSKDMMDARIADKLCDFWILVEDPGRAKVYKLDGNEFTGKVYYHHVETIAWPVLDDHPIMAAVAEKKHKRVTGQTASRFVTREEMDKKADNYWKKAEAKATFDFIRTAYQVHQDPEVKAEMNQSVLGDVVGMSQSNVSKIVNADRFEDFYTSFASA